MSTFSGNGGWGGWSGSGGWGGWAGSGGWSGAGGWSGSGGWAGGNSGGSGGYSPISILTNRDGIAGSWNPPSITPVDRPSNHPDNLVSWAPWVRAQLFDSELLSRITFSFGPENGTAGNTENYINVWHMEYDLTGKPAVPEPSTEDPPHQRVLANHLFSSSKPSAEKLNHQLNLIRDYIDLRQDRLAEITSQLGSPEAFLGTIGFLSPDRTPWTLELLGAVYRLALYVELRAKHDLAVRRPIELSPQIQPIIETPNHGSFPSGHATEAFALSTAFSILLEKSVETFTKDGSETSTSIYGEAGQKIQLLRLASRIAVNRTVAGVHYPIDSAVGALLGSTLGQYFAKRCIVDEKAKYNSFTFNAEEYENMEDFDRSKMFEGAPELVSLTPDYITSAENNIKTEETPLSWLWGKAIEEWRR